MSLCSADVEDEVVTYVQVEIAQSYAFVWFPLVLIGFGILVIQADLYQFQHESYKRTMAVQETKNRLLRNLQSLILVPKSTQASSVED